MNFVTSDPAPPKRNMFLQAKWARPGKKMAVWPHPAVDGGEVPKILTKWHLQKWMIDAEGGLGARFAMAYYNYTPYMSRQFIATKLRRLVTPKGSD